MIEASQSQYVKDCLSYLRHQKGLTMFWLWLERWLSVDGWTFDSERLVFCLAPNASARFLLGAPKPGFGAAGKPVFLGVQKEEEGWLTRIAPSRVIFSDGPVGDEAGRWLWLVCPGRTSPDMAWPDLPPVVLGIQLYDNQLVGWQGSRMDLRAVWWEETASPSPRVRAVPLASMEVLHGQIAEHWNPRQMFVKTLRERAIEQSEAALIARGLTQNPGFQGQKPVLDASQQELLSPFRGEIPPLVEENYYELFGQFIDGVEPGPRKR